MSVSVTDICKQIHEKVPAECILEACGKPLQTEGSRVDKAAQRRKLKAEEEARRAEEPPRFPAMLQDTEQDGATTSTDPSAPAPRTEPVLPIVEATDVLNGSYMQL